MNKEQIKKSMANYKANEFQLYCDEAGWEDWMNEHTTAKDGEVANEQEIEKITKIQLEMWNELHGQTA